MKNRSQYDDDLRVDIKDGDYERVRTKRRGRTYTTPAPTRRAALVRFPHSGRLTEITNEEVAHVRLGHQKLTIRLGYQVGRELETLDGLEGAYCAFVMGGSPTRFKSKKDDWDGVVVQWMLLDDLEEGMTADDYQSSRDKELNTVGIDVLCDELTAEWYVVYWQQKAKVCPQSLLHTDSLLDRAIEGASARSSNAEGLIRFIGCLITSPYYSISEADQERVCRRFLHADRLPLRVFIPSVLPEQCPHYSVVWPLCGNWLEAHINRARTVAIDLESDKDGRHIGQFGWHNAAGGALRSSATGLTDEELQNAARDSVLGMPKPCIVGQQLLAWDWRILQRRSVAFPRQSELWDTLIAAWMLEPWEPSHALIVKENAHRADVDAKRACEVFETQVARLMPCFWGNERDINSLVNRLFDGKASLSDAADRHYPDMRPKEFAPVCLYPRNRIGEVAWRKGCRVEFMSPEEDLADPPLDAAVCRRIALERGDVYAKVVGAVVADAGANEVEVRLSMLPPWLVEDGFRAVLREAHASNQRGERTEARQVYLAENVFKQPLETWSAWVRDQHVSVAYRDEVLRVWQTCCARDLPEEEVRSEFPGAVEGRTRRALLPVKDRNGNPAWLLYEPPGHGMESPAWRCLPLVPECLRSDSTTAGNQRIPADVATMPRWKDGGAASLDLDRLFVTPDTANRPLWLADLVHCLLNLLRALPANQILVCAMRWESEAMLTQQHLTQLSLSVRHAESPLRQLERLRQEGLRILACTHESLAAHVKAAGRLGQDIAIILDEAPLHWWYALMNEQDEDGEGHEPYELAKQLGSYGHVVLTGKDIARLVSVFMADWLKGLLKTDATPARPVLILDPRLHNQPSTRTIGVQREDFPFYSVDELLDDQHRAVYYDVCFPKRPDAEIPNSYEDYRSFLHKNWGYPDFWQGTQRPAIEALIGGRRDLLLRLPTGAGKSEVFQVPALWRSSFSRRLTIVITPLRALMQDQVQRLWQRHFKESVDFLSGGRDAWLNHEAYQGVLDGRVRLLYIAPERFRVPRFIDVLERRRQMDGGLEFVVIDEAHCVSEWGFEFRPDYLYAAQYVAKWFKEKDLPGNPHRLILASATVTRRNQADLEHELRLAPRGEYADIPADMPHPIQPFIVLESFDLPESEEVTADPKFHKIVEILGKLDLTKSAALVFVRKRIDCHRLSEALNAQAAVQNSTVRQLHVLPFHAGLPETVKTEACNLLENGTANVLVCTKAFGMGMDIPHLHACIHYRPPTFIEDYLQEVGRVGRSQKDREDAGHLQVSASLLYNNDDLEHNLGQLHDNAVKPSDLQSFFGYCKAHAMSFPGGSKSVCILPARVRIGEAKEFDENQVVNCLFWLERMGVLKVEGRHPPFLDLTLRLPDLRIIAERPGPLAPLARALLGIVRDTQGAVRMPPEVAAAGVEGGTASESGFSRFVRGLVRGFFALLSPAAPAGALPAGQIQPAGVAVEGDELRASVSVTELMAASGGMDADELFSGLFDMSRSGAVSVEKTFLVIKHTAPSSDHFWTLLEHAVKRLLRPTAGVEALSGGALDQELTDWYRGVLANNAPPEAPGQAPAEIAFRRQVKREVYRAKGAALRTVRYAGLPVTEGVSNDGSVEYRRAVSDTSAAMVRRGADERREAAERLVNFLGERERQAGGGASASFEVKLTDVMSLFGPNVRMSRLKELCKLVEVMGFYGLDSSSDEWVSIISMDARADLPEPDAELLADSKIAMTSQSPIPRTRIQEVYAEMAAKHELQVLRAQCMVLLAAMPAEGRRQFIDRYFDCMTANDITKALEDTVGEVSDDVLSDNEMLRNLLGQVRRERFNAEMQGLNDAQRAVCSAPASRRLFVNAGPGSGKTHVLMMRCAHLIHAQNIRPSEILVLAFNRAVVFEIRDRIRGLFRELGYGSYVRSLNVVTFHSFALRELQIANLFEEDAIEDAVHRFADRISRDPVYAQQIGGRYRAILVDEFQDMNEDFYKVVRALITDCQGGGMVIGDDDQDILTWNRREWRAHHHEECPLESVSYFRQFEEVFQPDKHTLTVNYRSGTNIVAKNNKMIAAASQAIHFDRMKVGTELVAFRTDPGIVEHPFDTGRLADIVADVMDCGDAASGNEPVAILCRTNRQCRQVYESLREHVDPARLQVLGSEDFPLHQLRPTGAMKDLCLRREEWEFLESYVWEELLDQYRKLGHADMQDGAAFLSVVYELVCAEKGRPRIRDVIDFIHEIRESDAERLKAKMGIHHRQSKVVISTVHKVKGLQYDTVIVMPSTDRFPLTDRRIQQPTVIDSAEEARLYYVAATRARNRLYIGLDLRREEEREYKWWHRQRFDPVGEAALPILKGSPKEVVVRWSGRTGNVDGGVQEYIEKHVNIGDRLDLTGIDEEHGRGIKHNDRLIGVLARMPPNAAALRVSNIIRYSCGSYFREHNRGYWNELHPALQIQGWFYVVLIETG